VAAQVDAGAAADHCNIENISVGGLFLRTSSPMPLGMPVRVDLTKAGQRVPLSVSGRVVSVVTEAEAAKHDVAAGVGIELDPMSADTERRYYALLRELGLQDLADPRSLEPDDLYGTAMPDTQQVASNVRGLLDMLTDALQRVKERDEKIAKLEGEVRRLTARLDSARR
jgi:hypothetical protein